VSGPSVGGVDPQLATFGSERQAQYIEAVNKHGSYGKAGKALGVSEFAVRSSIKRLVKLAATRGYSPDHDYVHPVPETHVAKGVSTYYDADGKVRSQWVKSDLRLQAYNDAVKGAILAFVEDLPKLTTPPAPRNFSTDVIPWVQIGDAHIGMLAHAAEVGENFDVKIAERELCAAIGQLVDEMPACERAVLNDLGDFTHYENFSATTEASGHPLDFDSRFPKMIRAYARVMRFIIERLLTKVQVLDVIINQGNHSRTNDIWCAVMLRALYEGNPRVNVLDNDSVFIGYRMGKTFVMVHHSDKCTPAKLPGVMTADFPKDFGETDFRYIDIGHVHHRSVALDQNGITVESWNHLAASDKWAHEAGYRSSKSITVVLRSKTYGEIGRRTLPIAEVRDRLYGLGHATPVKKPAFTVPE
jgi:hypothetical protein